jgi:hypothetical protein
MVAAVGQYEGMCPEHFMQQLAEVPL